MAPAVSLVITTYNRARLLEAALDSVARSKVDDASQVEVIVVDNNSIDDTPWVVGRLRDRGFPFALRYVRETRQGLSCARNAGIGKAQGDYVAFMDDDQTIDADYLSQVVPIFEQTSAACIGGPGIYLDIDKVPAWLRPLLELSVKASEQGQHSEVRVLDPGYSEHLVGGNMVVCRDDLLALGGFNEALGRRGDLMLAAEDAELQDRLFALGRPVVFHSGIIQYHYLHPDRCSKRYWRKRRFFFGRTSYIYKSAATFERSARLFHAPRWLWWCLLTRDLPAYIGSRFVIDAYRRFELELAVWRRLGEIYQARLDGKVEKR